MRIISSLILSLLKLSWFKTSLKLNLRWKTPTHSSYDNLATQPILLALARNPISFHVGKIKTFQVDGWGKWIVT